MFKKALCLAAAMAGFGWTPASAITMVAPETNLSYSVELPAGGNAITHMYGLVRGDRDLYRWQPESTAITNGTQSISGPGSAAYGGSTVQSFIMGLTTNLPGDAPGTEHVVFLGNQTATQGAVGMTFDEVVGDPFTFSESSVISQLKAYAANPNDRQAESYLFVLTIEYLPRFFFDTAITNPGEVTTAPFSLVAFSTGTAYGTGMVTYALAPVPEPGAWGLMALGLLVVGARARRAV